MNTTAPKERIVFFVFTTQTPKSTDKSQSPTYLA